MNTELFKVLDAELDISKLQIAANVIKKGGLVVFPTETVYGLGADATSAKAAEKIYAAKGRPSDNPLIIHIANPIDAEKYTHTTDVYYKLANRFMPGPLTVVLPAKDSVPLTVRGGLDTVAVRCPSNPIANKLISLAGVPVAAPSANISGSPSPTAVAHVIDDMMGRVDVIIDGGDCDFGLESTIVKLSEDGTLTLLRPGKITVDELSKIAPVHIASAVTAELEEGEKALSPGMKYKHYAPKAPLILVDGEANITAEYILSSKKGEKIAVICYEEDRDVFLQKIPDAVIYNFGKREDMLTQAHRLFFELREADKQDFDAIYAPLPTKDGIGLALYNRMIRAAAHKIIKL